MSDAETLLQAAETLRKRAQAATEGTWFWDEDGLQADQTISLINADLFVPIADAGTIGDTDGRYIAAMAPPVGNALADWLNVKAVNPGDHDHGYALTLARAVLDGAA
jgi:hypothetical protein